MISGPRPGVSELIGIAGRAKGAPFLRAEAPRAAASDRIVQPEAVLRAVPDVILAS